MGYPAPPETSPWVREFQDYLGLKVTITVVFNETTRALTSASVSRDDGCQWTKIVFDNPNDTLKARPLAAPADGRPDATYTAAQMSRVGFSTIEDVLVVQITADR